MDGTGVGSEGCASQAGGYLGGTSWCLERDDVMYRKSEAMGGEQRVTEPEAVGGPQISTWGRKQGARLAVGAKAGVLCVFATQPLTGPAPPGLCEAGG